MGSGGEAEPLPRRPGTNPPNVARRLVVGEGRRGAVNAAGASGGASGVGAPLPGMAESSLEPAQRRAAHV